MSVRIIPKIVFCVIATAIVGCQDSSQFVKSQHFENGDTLLTGAAVRSINRQVYNRDSRTGRLVPTYITCAEPSPDVATAISKAFSAEGALSAKGLPSNIEPEVAAAISASRAESVAQLGERLASIQLLRDGLYRACEAYANGAISPIIYAVMVGRYDDTMVTLLSGELAAGAFGRSAASLGSNTSGDGNATVDAQGNPTAASKSSATATATGAGAIAHGNVDASVAESIREIQRKFIENINSDALEIACISALDSYRPSLDTHPSALADFCNKGLFQEMINDKRKLLKNLKARAWAVADYEIRRDKAMKTLMDIEKYLDAESGLLKKYVEP